MRIHLFTQFYPSTYKPYYDTQFAQFIRDGHEIVVFAHGQQGPFREVATSVGLPRRVRWYPTTLRTLPRAAPEIVARALAAPDRIRESVRALRGLPDRKEQLMSSARAVLLPRSMPDLCFIHDLTTAITFSFLPRVRPGVPIAMYYHGGEIPRAGHLRPDAVSEAFDAVDVVFTNTRFSAAQAVARGCPADKVRVLPVGFSLDDYRPPAVRSYRPGGTLRLLSAGRVSEEKGHRFALEAIRQLVRSGVTDLHYTLVGSGYVLESLRAFVDEHHLQPFVEFAGELTAEALVRRLADTDVLLLPSVPMGNWMETQACVVQEALLMKTLVVASEMGGVPESTAPELHPYLVPPGDAGAIARAILAIRALDPAELRRLGEAGRAFAESGYDVRRLNQAILSETCAAPLQVTNPVPTL